MQLPALIRAVTAVPSCRASPTGADRCSPVRWRLPHFPPAPGPEALCEQSQQLGLTLKHRPEPGKWLGSRSTPQQRQVVSLLNKNNKTSPANLLKSRGLTPGCSSSCPPAPGAQQLVPFPGSAPRTEDKDPGPGAHPQPQPRLAARSSGPWCLRGSRAAFAGGAACSSRSQVLARTVASHSSSSSSSSSSCPPGFGAGAGPSLFFFFSSTSWRKKLCRTHITQERPFEPSKAPARDGRRSFPGEPEPGGHIPGQQQREIPPRQAKP